MAALAASCGRQSGGEIRAGIKHNPPYYFADSQEPRGMAFEVIDTAARRAGIRIRWVAIPAAVPADDALNKGLVDLYPTVSLRASHAESIHLTDPWLRSDYFLLTLADGSEDLNSLQKWRLAVVGSQMERRWARTAFPSGKLEFFNSGQEALRAVCDGRAGSAFLEGRMAQSLLLHRPEGCGPAALQFLPVPQASIRLAVGSTKEAAATADRIREEITRMAEDASLDTILSRWSFVTSKEAVAAYSLVAVRREAKSLRLGVGLLVAALLIFIALNYRLRITRRRAEIALTALQTTERSLRRSEQRLEQAQAIARVGSWEQSLETGELMWSAEAYRIFSLTPGTQVDRERFYALTHPEDRERVRKSVTEARANRSAYNVEHRIVTPEGERWVHERGEFQCDANGEPVRLAGTVQDITERVRLEERLRISQKLEAIGQLAGGVAHDFNNILTLVLGHANIILATAPEGSAERRNATEIVTAGKRAAALVDKLLAVGRKRLMYPQPLDLNHIIAELADMLRRMLARDVRLTTLLEPSLGMISADQTQIEQVLFNLVVNARDALPNGGSIEIETSRVVCPGNDPHTADMPAGRYVLLCIRDSGEGMTAQVKSRIFEPFFTTKKPGQGTGLGLPTVYGIVQQSGGFLRLESEPGKGTCFRMYFPMMADPPEQMIPAPAGCRVLLVEDDTAIRGMVCETLESIGYGVIAVEDAPKALNVPPASFDLLLTDIVMPGGNGVDLATHFRRQRPRLPVLFISGYSERPVPLDHPRTSAFLAKPFAVQALTDKVAALLHDEQQ